LHLEDLTLAWPAGLATPSRERQVKEQLPEYEL